MISATGTQHSTNKILEILQKTDSDKIKYIEMPLGKLLYNPHEKMEYVYFPKTAVISITKQVSK